MLVELRVRVVVVYDAFEDPSPQLYDGLFYLCMIVEILRNTFENLDTQRFFLTFSM